MKRTLLIVALLVATTFSAVADKGMWLPSLIGSRIKDMKSKGFKLSAEDIYSISLRHSGETLFHFLQGLF